MSERREATHVLMISLRTQLDLIEALVASGAIAPHAAYPLVAQIGNVADAWGHAHPDLCDMLAADAKACLDRLAPGRVRS